MRMVGAIGNIEEDLILEAMIPPKAMVPQKAMVPSKAMVSPKGEKHGAGPSSALSKNAGPRAPWLKWGGAAACLIMLVIASVILLPSTLGKNKQGMGDGRYKSFTLQGQELTAIIWPWEYQTVGEKYRTMIVNGMEYVNTGHKVSEAMLRSALGTFDVTGYDEIKEESHVISGEAYELNDVVANKICAVKLEDGYYVFRNFEYLPAGTLGELLDQANLPKLINLNWFEERGKDSKDKRFVLNDASCLWNALTTECREAKFIEDQNWMAQKREYLGFSISSEALGIDNVALYVTGDGYLWTNAFGWQSLYDIGEEAAGEIIQNCREHCTEIEAQPFSNAVIGTVTEITEEYFLVDDAVLCKDPKDGITYKVLLNDLRISRYVQMNLIKAGDMVEVLYRGQMDEENDHAIREATYASKVTIIDGEAYIFE